ncbi:MAG: GNAT family N-acetyltransferase [Anaerolineae bacterium]|nr:GNAT family N-acetyltransferase [Anaerolineae bacterium]
MNTSVRCVFTKDLVPADVARLFAQTGWTRTRTEEQISQMLIATPLVLAAFDGDRLIGIARVLTDDLFRAYVEDVIVDESCRGRGIGKQIMEALMERLAHVEEITFNCEEHLIPFYEQFGFERFSMTFMHIWRGGG